MATLKDANIGETVRVTHLNGEGALRQHFLDMGVIPGAEITVVKYAPMGDPVELLIHGYKLTLRIADAEKIETEPVTKAKAETTEKKRIKKSHHPGLGESGNRCRRGHY